MGLKEDGVLRFKYKYCMLIVDTVWLLSNSSGSV
jgi:hypothetical protein